MDKDKLIDKVLDNITFEKIIKHTIKLKLENE